MWLSRDIDEIVQILEEASPSFRVMSSSPSRATSSPRAVQRPSPSTLDEQVSNALQTMNIQGEVNSPDHMWGMVRTSGDKQAHNNNGEQCPFYLSNAARMLCREENCTQANIINMLNAVQRYKKDFPDVDPIIAVNVNSGRVFHRPYHAEVEGNWTAYASVLLVTPSQASEVGWIGNGERVFTIIGNITILDVNFSCLGRWVQTQIALEVNENALRSKPPLRSPRCWRRWLVLSHDGPVTYYSTEGDEIRCEWVWQHDVLAAASYRWKNHLKVRLKDGTYVEGDRGVLRLRPKQRKRLWVDWIATLGNGGNKESTLAYMGDVYRRCKVILTDGVDEQTVKEQGNRAWIVQEHASMGLDGEQVTEMQAAARLTYSGAFPNDTWKLRGVCGQLKCPPIEQMLTLVDKASLAIVCERVSNAGTSDITHREDRPLAYYSLIASMLGVDAKPSGLRHASTKCFELARCAPLCPLRGGANPTLTVYDEIRKVGGWLWKEIAARSEEIQIYQPLFGVDALNPERWKMLKRVENCFVRFVWKDVTKVLGFPLKYQATSGVCVVSIDSIYAYCAVIRALHFLAAACDFKMLAH